MNQGALRITVWRNNALKRRRVAFRMRETNWHMARIIFPLSLNEIYSLRNAVC